MSVTGANAACFRVVGERGVRERVRWHRTGRAPFTVAARVDGDWWVLRTNGVPDHPLWTLFVNGECRFDADDPLPGWGDPGAACLSLLEPEVVHEVLAPLQHFERYGSEVGQPCTHPSCCG